MVLISVSSVNNVNKCILIECILIECMLSNVDERVRVPLNGLIAPELWPNCVRSVSSG
jgi:hypothetical protein